MLIYDQPIDRAKERPGRCPPPRQPRRPASACCDLVAAAVAAARIAIISAALICRLRRGRDRQEPDARNTPPSAQLYVDPRELQLVDRELTPRAQDIVRPRDGGGEPGAPDHLEQCAAAGDPRHQSGQGSGIRRRRYPGACWDRCSACSGSSCAPTAEQQKQIADGARWRRSTATSTSRRPSETFIVDIDVWSNEPARRRCSPTRSAKAYLAESKQSQAAAARRATTDLSGRLKELQERLRNAENTLAVYKAQNNFVGTQDTLISDQQLSASNQRLAARSRADARRAGQIRPDRSQPQAPRADAGAIPEALQSPTIANLRAQYADARKR